jgi:hypothetical protein
MGFHSGTSAWVDNNSLVIVAGVVTAWRGGATGLHFFRPRLGLAAASIGAVSFSYKPKRCSTLSRGNTQTRAGWTTAFGPAAR